MTNRPRHDGRPVKCFACVALLLLVGCLIPFVHSHREQPRAPDAVLRFSEKAQGLTRAPGVPDLPDVTRSMSDAIEALPDVEGGGGLALEVRQHADAMARRGPNETDALAHSSLETALEALRRTKPAVHKADKDKAVEMAHHAIEKIQPGEPATVDVAYREVARAMVVITGGRNAAPASELSQLVARFAVEEPDEARRTGAQVIAAMGDALQRLPRPPAHASGTAHELHKRADRLAKAAPLDYSEQLRDALSLVVASLDRSAMPPAERRLLDDAKVAVDAIRGDRPLDLQHAAVQEALRLVTDAITVSVSAP